MSEIIEFDGKKYIAAKVGHNTCDGCDLSCEDGADCLFYGEPETFCPHHTIYKEVGVWKDGIKHNEDGSIDVEGETYWIKPKNKDILDWWKGEAKKHAEYTRKSLESKNGTYDIETVMFHYEAGLIHGFKHALEKMEE